MKKSNSNIPEGTLIIDYEYYKQLLWQSIEIDRLNNIIQDTKEVLLTTNNIEKALNILDRKE